MKKIILTFIALLLAGVNTALAQEETGKVRLYDSSGFVQGYSTLQAALYATNANTQTVKLFESTTETVNPCVYDNVTIDLNGCTVNLGSCYLALGNKATITDTSASQDGKITGNNENYSVNVSANSFTLTLTKGTIENTSTADNAHAIVSKGTVNLNGGTVTAAKCAVRAQDGSVKVDGCTINAGGYGIVVNNNSQLTFNSGSITAGGTAIATNGSDTGGAIIAINGGTISGTNAGIFQPIGTVSVTGGTISGATGIYQKSGTLNISGGTINGTGAATTYNYSGNGFTATGDGIVIDNCGYPGGTPTVSITGGNINSTNAQPVSSYVGNSVAEANKVVEFISGGTFSSPVPEEFCAAGYLPVKTVGGFGVTQDDYVAEIGTDKFVSLADAFGSVLEGDTIKLLKDVELTEDIECTLYNGNDSIYMQFGTYNVTKGNYSIKLNSAAANGARSAESAANVGGVVVKTDKKTDIFDAANEGEILLVGTTNDPNFPYYYQVVSETPDEAIAQNKQTGMLFSDLQMAVDLASAGNTIELLPGIENVTITKTVNINKGIILDGQNYKVTSSLEDEDQATNKWNTETPAAFRITGNGDVTINKLDLNVTFKRVDENEFEYTMGGIGIQVDNNYANRLSVNYSNITTLSRGIDVHSASSSFYLDVKHTKIYAGDEDLTDDDEFDPTTEYIHTFDQDPYQRSRGINFGAVSGAKANIQFCEIAGFSYPINAGKNANHIEVNMIDCTTYGRATVNNWGNSNKFNLSKITAHAYNNQEEGDTETFAIVVDNEGYVYENNEQVHVVASYNNYFLDDVKSIANVEVSDETLDTDATQKFVDLRGTDATVKITGASGYDIDENTWDRVGFMNNEQMHNLLDPAINNKIYFDDTAKAYFTFWFETIEPFEHDFGGEIGAKTVRLGISDEIDHTNLYPVIATYPKVMLTMTPEDFEGEPKVFYFETLKQAFDSEYFVDFAEITIMENITLDEDITPNLKRGESFTLGATDPAFKITPAEKPVEDPEEDADTYHILLDPLVTVYYDGDKSLFAPSEPETTDILEKSNYAEFDGSLVRTLTAANVYWSGDVEDINASDSYYWLFDELFTNDENATTIFSPGTYTRLEMDIPLVRDLKLPTASSEFEWDEEEEGDDNPARRMADDEEISEYWLDFNSADEYGTDNPLYTLDKGEYSISLKPGQWVYTTALTDVFSSGDPAYYVTYDVLEEVNGANVEKTLLKRTVDGTDQTIVFRYKYYLQKDGLAIIVDPATYCGDRLTPNFIVKKKVVNPDTDEETWVELSGISQEDYDAAVAAAEAGEPDAEDVSGYDFTWHLVPPATDDPDDKTYIDAKTYVEALVIEGISFQGIRKANFVILPRDIKDVTATGNVQPWTADGYSPVSIENTTNPDESIVGIEDLIELVYNCTNHENPANPILKKYGEEPLLDENNQPILDVNDQPMTIFTGDYRITVEPGPETDPQGYYKEIGTYSKKITITAVEGGNYTGTLVLDFIILPTDVIDISKCMVVSDATYTSWQLPPTKKGRIQVIWKDPVSGGELIVDPSVYTVEANAADESYVDAKTYSNALTIVADPAVNVGTEDAPLRFYGTLIADYVIKQRDLADSLDVITENDNQGKVTLEAYTGAATPTTPATIYLKWNNGNEIVPVINGATDNNINLILTAQKDTLENETTSDQVVWPLIPADYSYTIEPSPMVNPGMYKIIFTGRGNFTGMREVKVMVLKDISADAILAEVPLQIILGNTDLSTSELQDVTITDSDLGTELVEGVHYALEIREGEDGEDEATDVIKGDGVYFAHFKGLEPYYTNQKEVIFPAVFEYYSWDAKENSTDPGTAAAYYNNQTYPDGYTVFRGPLDNPNIVSSIHIQLPGKDMKATIGGLPSEGAAIDNTLEDFTLDGLVTLHVQQADGTDYPQLDFTVVGIDDDAFMGCNQLHWVDATQIAGYTPENLSRSETAPFNGYPVQSLVYLDGTQGGDVTGTNYIYKKGDHDFRCEELKIYDDQDGKQQSFTEGGGPKWEFRNIYEFTAEKVTNTRYFIAGQHYTTCLPYKLEVTSGLKVYTLDAASDNIFGFKELSLNKLSEFTPYLLIPSKGGNLLSNADQTVVYETPTEDQGVLNAKETPTGHKMFGSTIYMDKETIDPTVTGLYIMQSKNTWKKIPADPDPEYNGACVLPMRAYIQLPEGSPAREYIMAQFTDAIESLSNDVNDDWTDAEVYDLQGRKVDTTSKLPKGVYIVNGQKRIKK